MKKLKTMHCFGMTCADNRGDCDMCERITPGAIERCRAEVQRRTEGACCIRRIRQGCPHHFVDVVEAARRSFKERDTCRLTGRECKPIPACAIGNKG